MSVMNRFRAAFVVVCGLLLGVGSTAPAQAAPAATAATQVDVQAKAVPLDANDLTRTRVGELTYAGGLELRATDANFGGISGLVVSDDGAHFLAMSDRGTWMAGTLTYSGSKLSGVTGVTEAPMLDWRGQGLTYGNNDSEGLAVVGKEVYVSFEHFHRIWRYSLASMMAPDTVFGQTALALEPFPGLADQPSNGGLEAITGLADGSLLAVSEEARTEDGNAKAWIIKGKEAETLSLPVSDDFAPTDAATLANGDVLLLERRFSLASGVAMRLRLIGAASIHAGGVMTARPIAEITMPLTVDNMEGLAVVREGKGYRLLIVSDDNFNVLQRTLLLSFLWTPK